MLIHAISPFALIYSYLEIHDISNILSNTQYSLASVVYSIKKCTKQTNTNS